MASIGGGARNILQHNVIAKTIAFQTFMPRRSYSAIAVNYAYLNIIAYLTDVAENEMNPNSASDGIVPKKDKK